MDQRSGAGHYLDVYFNHAVNELERIKNPEWHEFAELARKQGKIRFTGMSGYAGKLTECLAHAIDSGRFEVILCAYNFGHDPHFYERFFRSFDFVAIQPDLPRVIRKAKEHGVGVVAMKTLMGARLNDMRPYESGGATYAQAAFRWVLSNAGVDALIVSMTSTDMIDEYLGASDARATAAADIPLRQRYAYLNAGSYDVHADCLSGLFRRRKRVVEISEAFRRLRRCYPRRRRIYRYLRYRHRKLANSGHPLNHIRSIRNI